MHRRFRETFAVSFRSGVFIGQPHQQRRFPEVAGGFAMAQAIARARWGYDALAPVGVGSSFTVVLSIDSYGQMTPWSHLNRN